MLLTLHLKDKQQGSKMEPCEQNDEILVAKAKPSVAKRKRRRKQRPKDFPKRPLSAYNFFFKQTRERILAEHKEEKGEEDATVDFQTLAKAIASRWKILPSEERDHVGKLAEQDMRRYRKEVKEYEEEMVKKSNKERKEAEAIRQQRQQKHPSETEAAIAFSFETTREPPQGGMEPDGSASGSLVLTSGSRNAILAQLQQDREAAALPPAAFSKFDFSENANMYRLLQEELVAIDTKTTEIRQSLQRPGELLGPGTSLSQSGARSNEALRTSLGFPALQGGGWQQGSLLQSTARGGGAYLPSTTGASLQLSDWGSGRHSFLGGASLLGGGGFLDPALFTPSSDLLSSRLAQAGGLLNLGHLGGHVTLPPNSSSLYSSTEPQGSYQPFGAGIPHFTASSRNLESAASDPSNGWMQDEAGRRGNQY
jgi:hypothetical protein